VPKPDNNIDTQLEEFLRDFLEAYGVDAHDEYWSRYDEEIKQIKGILSPVSPLVDKPDNTEDEREKLRGQIRYKAGHTLHTTNGGGLITVVEDELLDFIQANYIHRDDVHAAIGENTNLEEIEIARLKAVKKGQPTTPFDFQLEVDKWQNILRSELRQRLNLEERTPDAG
jgi:hypothetical protein